MVILRTKFSLLSCFVLYATLAPIALQASDQAATVQVIDGSVHPELISDSLASRFVLISFALPPSPTTMEIKKQRIRLARLALDPADLGQFTALLANFSSGYSQWKSTVTSQDPAAAAFDKEKLVGDFFLRAEQHLSADGFKRFTSYIQAEKRKMTE